MTPIKNNRLTDTTLPTRLRSFLLNTQVNDAGSYEELHYLIAAANKLLEHQIRTATDKDEIDYLERIHAKEIQHPNS